MNSYLSLVPRYLKKMRKRSALVILGVMLSVALITSAGIISSSLKHSNIKFTEKQSGTYHALVKNLNIKQLDIIKSHIKVKSTGEVLNLGQYSLPGGIGLLIEGYGPEALDMSNLSLKTGSWPHSDYEIVLEEWILDEMGLSHELGQTIKLPTSKDETVYKLAGIMENSPTAQFLNNSRAVVSIGTVEQLLSEVKIVPNLYLQFKEGYPIRETGAEIIKTLGIDEENISFNESLLLAAGDNKGIDYPVVLLSFIVLVATVAAIYNVFSITVLERIKQFGLLRSVGATPKQIKRLVLSEALFLSLIGIPLGMLLGIFPIKLVMGSFSVFSGVATQVVVPGWLLGWAAAISMVSVFISAVKPAALAGRVSPLEAVRCSSVPVKESFITAKKWHGMIFRVFGVEGKLAYRNLWRHRRRFFVTIFSMCIGIVLFIVFSFFVLGANPDNILKNQYIGEYRVVVNGLNGSGGNSEEAADALGKIRGVAELYKTKFSFATTYYKEGELAGEYLDKMLEKFKRTISRDPQTELYTDTTNFYGYSDNVLHEMNSLLIDGSIDTEKLREGSEILMMNNTVSGVKATELKVGDEVRIRLTNFANGKLEPGVEKVFRIGGIVEGIPVYAQSMAMGATFITSEDVFEALNSSRYYMQVDLKLKGNAEGALIGKSIDELSKNYKFNKVISYEDEIKKLKDQKSQISLLLYLLVGVIALIGASSIVNTISTNLLLRTQEFGIMRAVGMTGRQMTKMIRTEGLFYGIISSIWGTAAGFVLAFVLYLLLKREATYLIWKIPGFAVLLAWACSVLLGMVSTVPPIKRISSSVITGLIKTVE